MTRYQKYIPRLVRHDISDVAHELAQDGRLSEASIHNVLESAVELIQQKLLAGESVDLNGLGVFVPKMHRGHPIQFSDNAAVIEDRVVAKFQVAKDFRVKLRDNFQGDMELLRQRG